MPKLLVVGPIVVEKKDDFRRFLLMVQAYRAGAQSLRKARVLCCQRAREWGADESLAENWQQFRNAAFVVETLFSAYWQIPVQLFDRRLGEGMPWIGLTDRAATAYQLAEEFIAWCDAPNASTGAA